MAEHKILRVPFDTKGNQEHYPNKWGSHGEYRDNYEFLGVFIITKKE